MVIRHRVIDADAAGDLRTDRDSSGRDPSGIENFFKTIVDRISILCFVPAKLSLHCKIIISVSTRSHAWLIPVSAQALDVRSKNSSTLRRLVGASFHIVGRVPAGYVGNESLDQ